MDPTRRSLFVAGFAGAAATVAASALAPRSARAADDYPSRPVRLVVPYAAGGGPDVLARRMATGLGQALGQNVVVENRVGAGGIIAAEVVAQATADGYTLMLGASNHVTQKLIQPSVRFDPSKSFTHIGLLAESPGVLVVAADSPWRDVAALVAAAKARPGALNYASGGIGSAAHLSAAGLATATGMDVVHVPYKGSVEIVPSIVQDATQFAFPIASTAVPLVQAGRIRALAVTSGERIPALPDVPTLREALGREELVFVAWFGLWGPAGLPPKVTDRVHAALARSFDDAALRDAYVKAGSIVVLSDSPAAFTRYIEAESRKYARIVEAARISVN